MGLFRKHIEQLKDRRTDHYMNSLLMNRIRLSDVPEWLRRDRQRCFGIYAMAFRIDRNISVERYKEDLRNLELEIVFVQALGNLDLANKLSYIKDCMEQGLRLFKTY